VKHRYTVLPKDRKSNQCNTGTEELNRLKKALNTTFITTKTWIQTLALEAETGISQTYSADRNYTGYLVAKNVKKLQNQCSSQCHKYYENEIAQKKKNYTKSK
jgi:hypothetical protein